MESCSRGSVRIPKFSPKSRPIRILAVDDGEAGAEAVAFALIPDGHDAKPLRMVTKL